MILFVGFLLMEIVMPQISRTALVPYSAEQMYQLVNDVQSYPQFLPGCTGSRILESTPGQMTAAVDVFAGLYRKSDSGVHSWADDCGGRCL